MVSATDPAVGKGPCIGLLGGLGVGATVHYYRKLAVAHEEQGVRLDLVMVHAETSKVFQFVQAADVSGLAGYLMGFIDRLAAAGAETLVMPSVTPHFCIDQLTVSSPLPILDLFDPLRREVLKQETKRVAVFGTRYVMDSNLFGKVPDLDFVRVRAEEADYIHQTYLALVAQGYGLPEQHRGLTELAQSLCRRESLDSIILAGTDLALLLDESNTDFPSIDCAALHLGAIMSRLIGA